MKYMSRKVITIKRQAKAVQGYATAVRSGSTEIAIMARTMAELEAAFHQFPGCEVFVKSKVRRVFWVAASKATTTKAMAWPPLNGSGS